jgi:dsRNA-specific ribonuclease
MYEPDFMNDTDYSIPHKSFTIRWLAERLGVKDLHAELKKALTHKSFYNEGNEQKTNSRYVFLGMYGFKGKVAELVFNFVPGSGTQLQHYLGNIFKDDLLLKVFDRYRLRPLCRFGSSFDIQKQKHVMAYGFLGFIFSHLETAKLEQFIIQNFIEGSYHLLPGQNHNRDLLSQCNYFARLRFNKKPVLQIQKLDNGNFCASVLIGDEEISKAESVSYKYSRKKAMKQAVLILSAPLRVNLNDDPVHQTIEEELERAEVEKKLAQKEEKQKQYLERQAKRAELRAIKKEEKKIEAQERELARRKAKAKAKARAEIKAKAAAEKDAAMQNISVAKRRHLQDKQK